MDLFQPFATHILVVYHFIDSKFLVGLYLASNLRKFSSIRKQKCDVVTFPLHRGGSKENGEVRVMGKPVIATPGSNRGTFW